ncbi:MAG: conjugal transfer protein TraN [Rhabdochlamydiaceae bacterium]|nr:conjugal transfer protein TraN [Candidatus Amphrikana amoebophyrae]
MKGIKWTLVYLSIFQTLLFSNEPEDLFIVMKNLDLSREEAKEIGRSQNRALIDRLGLGKEQLSIKQVVSRVEMEVKDVNLSHGEAIQKGREVQAKLPKDHVLNKKKEEIDSSESFLFNSMKAIDNENFDKELDIAKVEEFEEEEESKIKKCRESGSYLVSIEEELSVEVTPPKTKEIIKCNGHQKHLGNYVMKKNAQRIGKRYLEELKQNPKIEQSSGAYYNIGGFKKYSVQVFWRHNDGISCSSHYKKREQIEARNEIDNWSTNNKDYLRELQESPHCSLIQQQVVEGSGNRIVNGFNVYRDAWKRIKFFSCVGDNSSCEKLRNQGGIVIKKKCIRETEFGECREWEKEFDMGGLASRSSQKIQFKKERIYGLHESTTPPNDRNMEFTDAISKLSMLSEISDDLADKPFQPQTVEIFSGEPRKCYRSFIGKKWYDCCKRKKEGIAIKTKLAECNEEENLLYDQRGEGKCRYIGKMTRKMGLETSHIFCCFPTKLSKILHEEGRKQLGLSWGTAECPKCEGLTLEQFQRIDFDKIDLTEALEEFSDKLSAENLIHKLQNASVSFKNQNYENKMYEISETEKQRLENAR